MRFVFEKCTIELVQRRAAEESARNNGKHVTDVYLNREEWGEFCLDFYERNKHLWFNLPAPLAVIHLRPLTTATSFSPYAPITYSTTINVSLDPRL